MVKDLEGMSHEEQLRSLGLWRGDWGETSQHSAASMGVKGGLWFLSGVKGLWEQREDVVEVLVGC